MAKLANFYGWTHDYISGLSHKVSHEYFKAMEVIKAQDRLVDLSVSDYPNSKQETRSNLHKEFRKKAKPMHLRENEMISFEKFGEAVSSGS